MPIAWRRGSSPIPTVTKRLFDEVAPRFTERPGGYIRLRKLGPPPGRRRRDGGDGTGRAGRRAKVEAAHTLMTKRPHEHYLRATVAYDGTDFLGFQWQTSGTDGAGGAGGGAGPGDRAAGRVVGSGRTDTGVHARGQVIGFRTAGGIRCPICSGR